MSDRPGRPLDTYSGKRFFPLDPRAVEISLDDIAHGLANTCRYSGQCQHYYSVATHSVYVSEELADEPPQVQLYGLLHDAAEAYVGDVPRPLKAELDGFEHVEADIREAVWTHLRVRPPTDEEWATVMAADDRLLRFEADTLLAGFQPDSVPSRSYDLGPVSPGDARDRFLTRAEDLLEAVPE